MPNTSRVLKKPCIEKLTLEIIGVLPDFSRQKDFFNSLLAVVKAKHRICIKNPVVLKKGLGQDTSVVCRMNKRLAATCFAEIGNRVCEYLYLS